MQFGGSNIANDFVRLARQGSSLGNFISLGKWRRPILMILQMFPASIKQFVTYSSTRLIINFTNDRELKDLN